MRGEGGGGGKKNEKDNAAQRRKCREQRETGKQKETRRACQQGDGGESGVGIGVVGGGHNEDTPPRPTPSGSNWKAPLENKKKAQRVRERDAAKQKKHVGYENEIGEI